MAKFKIGDRVRWTSQSGGSSKTKEGVVVFVHDNVGKVSPYKIGEINFPKHKMMFDGCSWEYDAVLVEVRDGKTDRATPKLYKPKMHSVEKVTDDA